MVDLNDPPTPISPIRMACPRCGGKDAGCHSCESDGRLVIDSDPRGTVPAWCYRVASMADMYIDNGLAAVAGGQLDQANWFSEAAVFCHASRERILADMYDKA